MSDIETLNAETDDTDVTEISPELKSRHTVNAKDAREQASEGRYSFLRSEFRTATNGEVFEIPHKDLLDNDQQERHDELIATIRTYDREPDVVIKGEVVTRGQIILPHHKDGQLVKPSWPQRLAEVLWGKEAAQRARDGGILLNEIEIIWGKQRLEMDRRLRRDPKSDGGDTDVAPASD